MRKFALRTLGVAVAGAVMSIGAAGAASADPITTTTTTEISTQSYSEIFQNVHTTWTSPNYAGEYWGQFHSVNLSESYEVYVDSYTWDE